MNYNPDKLRFVPYADGSYIDIYVDVDESGKEVRLGHFLLPHDVMHYRFVPNQKWLGIIHLEQILEKLKELNK